MFIKNIFLPSTDNYMQLYAEKEKVNTEDHEFNLNNSYSNGLDVFNFCGLNIF